MFQNSSFFEESSNFIIVVFLEVTGLLGPFSKKYLLDIQIEITSLSVILF